MWHEECLLNDGVLQRIHLSSLVNYLHYTVSNGAMTMK